MRLKLAGLALSAAALLAGGAHAQENALNALNERLDGLVDQIGNNKGACTDAQMNGLNAGIADKLFPQIETFMRAKVITVALFCDINDPNPKHNDPEGAAALARQLEPIAKQPEEVGIANLVLFFYGMDKNQFDGPRLVTVLNEWPEGMAGMSAPELQRILQAADKSDPKTAQAAYQAVLSAPWEAPDIIQAVNNDWALDYAYLLANQKDMDGVRKAIASMDDPTDLMQIAEDRRFESLWPDLEERGRFNWKVHSQVTLEAAIAAAAANPDDLGPATTLMKAFLREDRLAEAMPLGEKWRARIRSKAAIPDKDNTDDFLDAYGAVLVNANKLDEAGKVYAEAAAASDDKASHALNWSLALISAGQFDQAAKALNGIDRKNVTPMGVAWIEAGLACAQAKDHAAEAKTRAGKVQAKDNAAAAEMALLCVDSRDAAAELYVKRFTSLDDRVLALEAVRTGDRPKEATAWDLEMDKRKQAVLATPAVAKALTAVGRRVEAPVQLSSLGSF